jgi:protein associated with RNAse G/E
LVTEGDGRKWITKEKAIFLLFKKRWMNVIAMFKENKQGICYYVNIASPTILDKGYLKYIDYDLDVKLYPDMVEKTLDEREFAHNAEHYGYSPELRKKIEKTKDEVLRLIDQRAFPFQNAEIERLFQTFLDRNRPQN